ncbi:MULTISPECIES: hypothetical protein [Prauserella salsuginis group]|uniref:Uncharacterized protein n=2 Tax=Prauserella salsuginis group TaxID=2893672 RepID=A0A839XMN0_9PSEU|nr:MULTISPECIES: hypothetical protein [Prauserella salsuginis group]MBB3661256.1 hypothetical protein [Prauserella sediminis]
MTRLVDATTMSLERPTPGHRTESVPGSPDRAEHPRASGGRTSDEARPEQPQ